MKQLQVPGTLLTSADDPVVPVSDAHDLPDIPGLKLEITPHGGHCGFLENWKLESWAEAQVVRELQENTGFVPEQLSEQWA